MYYVILTRRSFLILDYDVSQQMHSIFITPKWQHKVNKMHAMCTVTYDNTTIKGTLN